VWAAIADSDFHEEMGDFWPCEFAATWVYAPDRTIAGVLRALHAGSFFAEHGHIAREVTLTLRTEGLSRAAVAGETVEVSPGVGAVASIQVSVPDRDYSGEPNRLDELEIISMAENGAQTVHGPPDANGRFESSFKVPPAGIILRARGRRIVSGGPHFMFYTNPIRVSVAQP